MGRLKKMKKIKTDLKRDNLTKVNQLLGRYLKSVAVFLKA